MLCKKGLFLFEKYEYSLSMFMISVIFLFCSFRPILVEDWFQIAGSLAMPAMCLKKENGKGTKMETDL